jgi:hypothetical protein
MNESDPAILALRTIAKEWRKGHSETAFRRWNRTYSELQLDFCADTLDAVADALCATEPPSKSVDADENS